MKALKTKFPCRICEAPSEVRRLRDGPHAICERCSALRRLLMLTNFAYEQGGKAIKKGQSAADDVGLVRFWAEGLGEYLKGINRCMEAMPSMSPHLRRAWSKDVASNLRWVSKRATELVPFAEAIAADTFEIVAGGGESSDQLEPRAGAPKLRVVPGHRALQERGGP